MAVPSQKGFSLIELSIVLVIIGLLLGAVVGGQTLIRNAELQSIATEAVKYKEAVTAFKKQYNAIPGDMVDATEFWDVSPACGGVAASGTCNGNGNNIIEFNVANSTAEAYQFWRQLALSGRITGNFSGITGSGSAYHSQVGVNVPESRLTLSGWDIGNEQDITDAAIFDGSYGNYFRIGKQSASGLLNTPLLTPEEAWKIDTKLDDGMPGRGTIIASHPISACSTASTTSGIGKPYNLSNTTEQCTLFFVNQF